MVCIGCKVANSLDTMQPTVQQLLANCCTCTTLEALHTVNVNIIARTYVYFLPDLLGYYSHTLCVTEFSYNIRLFRIESIIIITTVVF
jgi:hypothetical protein